jgi:rubrerythrin
MSITEFTADEIFEMAEQIERNGGAFYRKAAEGFDHAPVKAMLQELAAMEDGHERVFADLRRKLTQKDRQAPVFDPDDQAVRYLRAMASGYVFDVKVQPADNLSGNESLEEILRVAIGLERDSIAFYVGLREVTPEQFGRDKIEWIIREEIQHVNLLSGKLAELAG